MAPDPVLAAFERQAAWCSKPSPFTSRLLGRTRAWLERDGDARAAFAAVAADPMAAALPLRWAGALHHLALRGLHPWTVLWPPAGGGDDATLDDAIAHAWSARRADVDAALARPPQTNEVQRCTALLPGLLHVAAATGRPLALLEIGSSAGLNLWCDRWRYGFAGADGWQWGDTDAGLALRCDWRSPDRPPTAPLQLQRRAGCDADPIDLRNAGEALRLTSFVWPDQPDRLERSRTAQRLAAGWMAEAAVAVERAAAPVFVARRLAQRADGVATVLMHSFVWQYMAAADQAGVAAAMASAGARASAAAPLAWLRFEPAGEEGPVELRCRLWPGGADRLLAVVHPHANWVDWRA